MVHGDMDVEIVLGVELLPTVLARVHETVGEMHVFYVLHQIAFLLAGFVAYCTFVELPVFVEDGVGFEGA